MEGTVRGIPSKPSTKYKDKYQIVSFIGGLYTKGIKNFKRKQTLHSNDTTEVSNDDGGRGKKRGVLWIMRREILEFGCQT